MAVLRMSHTELSRLDTLGRLERGELHVDEAVSLLGVTRRQIYRLRVRLRCQGPEGLISGKRGRVSNCPSSEHLALMAA
jgi:predicted DNA-binding transcriptional regulator YafY